MFSIFRKDKKWENCNGVVNLLSDLELTDLKHLLKEKGITSVQFYTFKNPTEKCWRVLNILFEKHPEIELCVNWDDRVNIDFLKLVPDVKRLTLKLYSLKHFEDVGNMDKLEELHIGLTKSKAVNMAFLMKLSNLKILSIDGAKKGIQAIDKLVNLESLNLRGQKLEDLKFLKGLNKLRMLKLMYGSVNSLLNISSLSKLKYLGISRVNGILDLKFIEKLETIHYFHFEGLSKVEELPNFRNLKSIRKLQLSNMKRLLDVRTLSDLKYVEEFVFTFPENILYNNRNKLIAQLFVTLRDMSKLKSTNIIHWFSKDERKEIYENGIKDWSSGISQWNENREGGWTL